MVSHLICSFCPAFQHFQHSSSFYPAFKHLKNNYAVLPQFGWRRLLVFFYFSTVWQRFGASNLGKPSVKALISESRLSNHNIYTRNDQTTFSLFDFFETVALKFNAFRQPALKSSTLTHHTGRLFKSSHIFNRNFTKQLHTCGKRTETMTRSLWLMLYLKPLNVKENKKVTIHKSAVCFGEESAGM